MKRCLILLLLFFCSFISLASTPAGSFSERPDIHAKEVMIYIGSGKQPVSMYDLSQMKVRQFEKIAGKKMKLFERIAFAGIQKKIRNSINKEGFISDSKMKRLLYGEDPAASFHAGGFFLGFLGAWIGIAIAYLIKDEHRKRRQKWAWIGFGASIIAFGLIILGALIFI